MPTTGNATAISTVQPPKNLNGFYLNVHSLISIKGPKKPKFLQELSTFSSISFISLTETWLRPGVEDAEVAIPGFTLIRCDRERPTNPIFPHGGVCLYLKNSIHHTSTKMSNGEVEVLIVHLTDLDTILVNLYRPPSSPQSSLEEAFTFICNYLACHTNSTVICMGDFNFPSNVVEWKKCEGDGLYPVPKSSSKSLQCFEPFMFENGLTQLVGQKTSEKNILDLGLTNDPDLHQDILVSTLNISDHHLLQINTFIRLLQHADKILPPKADISKFLFDDHLWVLVNES